MGLGYVQLADGCGLCLSQRESTWARMIHHLRITYSAYRIYDLHNMTVQ